MPWGRVLVMEDAREREDLRGGRAVTREKASRRREVGDNEQSTMDWARDRGQKPGRI